MPPLSPDDHDARALAVAELLSIAAVTQDALTQVDQVVADEQKLMDPLRQGFSQTTKAGILGLGRFGATVRDVGAAWESVGVRRVSTPIQEASSIFLWLLNDRYALRVKHEPGQEIAEGTMSLFSELPAKDRPVTAFLTWDVGLDGTIARARFVSVHHPRWTIHLRTLVDELSKSPTPIGNPGRRKLVVRSRPNNKDQEASRRDEAQ
jgi:hypothetical protein